MENIVILFINFFNYCGIPQSLKLVWDTKFSIIIFTVTVSLICQWYDYNFGVSRKT